jgi:hypothetical protein
MTVDEKTQKFTDESPEGSYMVQAADDTKHDAVFGELGDKGPNFRAVSDE